MSKFVVVDLETTGHTPSKGDRIIEVGIVVVENDRIVTEFSSLVNPQISIPSFISNLTGISDEDIKDAPLFEEIAEEVAVLFQDAYIVAHNVPFDLGFLNFELEAIGRKALNQPVIDTVELARIMLPQSPGYKLGQLSEHLALQHSDPHRALSDAYVTAKLLLLLLTKIRSLPFETLTHLQQLGGRLKSDLDTIFQEQIDDLSFAHPDRQDLEIYRGIALKKEEKEENQQSGMSSSFADYLDDIYQDGGRIGNALENYERRPSQQEMSEAIFDAFQSNKHALIEAETGTGKSLAYLVPAVYESVMTGQRVVISTHLTQLQAQLLEKEIPLLQQILPFSFRTALIKGKQHYLSLKKFEKELFSFQWDNYDIALTKAILLVWLTETTTGDIDEVQLPSSGEAFFRTISMDAEGYTDPQSPWFSRSFYQRARNKVQKANLVITNHSLLCTDMNSNHPLLPSFKKAIIDEAHHLEATAAKHFGVRLDYVYIQYTLNLLGSGQEGDWIEKLSRRSEVISDNLQRQQWAQLWQQAKSETDDFFRYIFSYVVAQHKKDVSVNDIGRYQYRFEMDKEIPAKWEIIKEMASRLILFLRDLVGILNSLKEAFTAYQTDSDVSNELEDVQNHIDKLEKIIDELKLLFLTDDETHVKWIEIEASGAKNAVYVYSEPIEVADALFEQLFEKKDSIILTSATLTMKQSFHFIRDRLGLSEKEVIEKKIVSPFQYDHQVQLMVPNDFPDIKYGKQEDFIYAACEAIYSMAEVTNGRMLVLFTSYDMLRKAYNTLRELTENKDFILIAQGVSSGSKSRLKKNFQAFDKAILLGTSSFWEGVDIPGSDLSCLMIVRLPFQPPNHPIYEAKAGKFKQTGKNPFMELSLPQAVIRFKQGFGRLIRSSTDRGIVFVCDDRLIKAKYGKYFIDSIPKVPVTYDSTQKLIGKAEDWL